MTRPTNINVCGVIQVTELRDLNNNTWPHVVVYRGLITDASDWVAEFHLLGELAIAKAFDSVNNKVSDFTNICQIRHDIIVDDKELPDQTRHISEWLPLDSK